MESPSPPTGSKSFLVQSTTAHVSFMSPRNSLEELSPVPTPTGSLSRSRSARLLGAVQDTDSMPNTLEAALFQLQWAYRNQRASPSLQPERFASLDAQTDTPFFSVLRRYLVEAGAWEDTRILDLLQAIKRGEGCRRIYSDFLSVEQEPHHPPGPLTVYQLFKEDGFAEAARRCSTLSGEEDALRTIEQIAVRYLNARYFGPNSITKSDAWEALSQPATRVFPRKSSVNLSLRGSGKPADFSAENEIVKEASKLCVSGWIELPTDLCMAWDMEWFIARKTDQIVLASLMGLLPVVKALKELPSVVQKMSLSPSIGLLKQQNGYQYLPKGTKKELEAVDKTLRTERLRKRLRKRVAEIVQQATRCQRLRGISVQPELVAEDAYKKLNSLVNDDDISRDFCPDRGPIFGSFRVVNPKLVAGHGPGTENSDQVIKHVDLASQISDQDNKVIAAMKHLIGLVEPGVNDEMVEDILRNRLSSKLLHHVFASMTIKFRHELESKLAMGFRELFADRFRVQQPRDWESRVGVGYQVNLEKTDQILTSIIHRQAAFRSKNMEQLASWVRTLTYTLNPIGVPCSAQITFTGFHWEPAASVDERWTIFQVFQALEKRLSSSSSSQPSCSPQRKGGNL